MQDNSNQMAGIYIHVPFCKQACHYCDFHFSTNTSQKAKMVECLTKELLLRSKDFTHEMVETIYFGGGTPSLLTKEEIHAIFQVINQNFTVTKDSEITLEANPDDLHRKKLDEIRNIGINRLSIGIQTFDEKRLSYMNRAHNRKEAEGSLTHARQAGFDNISADLIYAIPPSDLTYWQNDLEKLLSFNVEHISLYGLTIEDKTVFGNRFKKGQFQEVKEEMAAQQYELAVKWLKTAGYDHYEISNFGKPGFYSRHNTGYWEDKKYLGIGPGAHSYDGHKRGFNISHNTKYLQQLTDNQLAITFESSEGNSQLNDYIFTHLRTQKGINCKLLHEKFEVNLIDDNQAQIDAWLSDDLVIFDKNVLKLTLKGFMLADEITWRLFYDN